MAKIIRIDGDKVYIGTDNGMIREFHVEDLNFEPVVGKEVEFYTTGNTNINKGCYCWLAFLTGGIGLHKLYAKKYVAFALYLIFCWTYIPALISFFEFIGALFTPSDKNGNIKI